MIIENLREYNKLFEQDGGRGDKQSADVFHLIDRSSKLILSAPHATQSFCFKKEKCADLYTGALVKYLGEQKNISTIVRMKFTPYKSLISDYITEQNLDDHFFLDIHGFNRKIKYDVCLGIGTYNEENYPYLQQIINMAEKYGLKTMVNHPLYTGEIGLTGRYQKKFHKPNVIQVELKLYLRDFFNNPDTVKNVTLPFLADVIDCYK